MNNIEVVFARPGLLYLLIPALLLTVLPFLFLKAEKKKSVKRIVILLLRSVIITTVCLIIAGINVVSLSAEQSVAIVVDLSDSTQAYQTEMIEQANKLRKQLSENGQVCVVAFAGNQVEAVGFSEDASFTFTKLESDASDLFSAIDYAVELLPKDRGKRIVLLSDGRQTDGNALDAARYAAGVGVRIDAIYYDPAVFLENELQLTALKGPDAAFAGKSFTLSVEIDSTLSTDITLVLSEDGKEVQTVECEVNEGSNVWELEVLAEEEGEHIYTVSFQSEEDTLEINNRASTCVKVEGKPRVLMIAQSAYELGSMKQLVREQCDVTVTTPSKAPKTVAELCEYDEVVLVNVNASSMPDNYGKLLREYVSKYGRTLLTIGGNNTYTRGKMKGTVYEEILPINMNYTGQDDKNVALMLVIDCSRSMANNSLNLPLAKQGAIMCVESLKNTDYVGLVSFSSTATLHSSPVKATESNVEALTRVISSIQVGSGTAYYPALSLAYEELQKVDAPVKHVIFLSDGEPFDSGYLELAADMRKSDITVSTVGLAYLSSVLEDMATLGGGNYYYAPTAKDLPDIMLGDTELVTSTDIVLETTKLQIVKKNSIVEGFDNASVPSVDGYFGVEAKKDAKVILAAENGDPILAYIRVGAGMTVSYMSDVSGDWSGEWFSTEEGDILTQRMITETVSRIPIVSSLNVVLGDAGNTTDIVVESSGTETEGSVCITVNSEFGTEEVVLQNTGKGIYSGAFTTENAGTYEISVLLTDKNQKVDETVSHLIVTYKKEYDLFTKEGRKLMNDICVAGGGKLFDIGDNLSELSGVLPITVSYSNDLLIPLGIFISMLLLLDIGLRKLRMKDIKQFFGGFGKKH